MNWLIKIGLEIAILVLLLHENYRLNLHFSKISTRLTEKSHKSKSLVQM